MAGLEDLGIPGGDYLRESLTNCSDPLAAIEEFQIENGILLPSLKPALPFLDLHEIKRLDFHNSVLEELRDKLISRISELSNGDDENRFDKLNSLLEKSFPVVKVKSLRPVVMAILKHLPKIDDKYLTKILDDKELYAEAATEVKRQIWQDNQALFGDEVSPLLSQYIKEKENALFNPENASMTFFSLSPRSRRQAKVVTTLTDMVGKNVKLYDMVLQFLRTLFLRTRNAHYCTLRAELLMSLHDLEVNEICSLDPCHKFTWCVDACIRDRFIDPKRSRELQGFLDGIRKEHEFVLGDLSMILCDPFAVNTVALSIMRNLQTCLNLEQIPRENVDLVLLMRMLTLGLGAWDMIDSQVFKEPKLDPQLFTKYLPTILSMITDDQIRQVTAKFPDEPLPHLTQPSELYATFIKESNIASIVAMYYTAQAAKNKDRFSLLQVLPTLIHCENDRAFEDTFLHMLTSFLITMAEDFAQEDFCVAVMDDFYLLCVSKENLLRHFLRLLWHVHHKIPPARLEAVMENIAPNNEHSEVVHSTYQQLSERIQAYEPSPAVAQDDVDSPLLSVPAPTPAPY